MPLRLAIERTAHRRQPLELKTKETVPNFEADIAVTLCTWPAAVKRGKEMVRTYQMTVRRQDP